MNSGDCNISIVPSIICIVLIIDYERSRRTAGSVYLIFRSLFVSLTTDLFNIPGEGCIDFCRGLPGYCVAEGFWNFILLKDGKIGELS